MKIQQVAVQTDYNRCAQCFESLPKNSQAIAIFRRDAKLSGSRSQVKYLCDEICLSEYRQSGSERLLSKLAIQFN